MSLLLILSISYFLSNENHKKGHSYWILSFIILFVICFYLDCSWLCKCFMRTFFMLLHKTQFFQGKTYFTLQTSVMRPLEGQETANLTLLVAYLNILKVLPFFIYTSNCITSHLYCNLGTELFNWFLQIHIFKYYKLFTGWPIILSVGVIRGR